VSFLTRVRGITYAPAVIAIVGAGAAGLATAIFAARRGLAGPILLFEGARRPGAKILVSGGSRCNVTNAVVTEADFSGAPRHLVRRVLRGFGVAETIAFFREIGVALHE
jgi:predicted flavoprotein YhiN